MSAPPLHWVQPVRGRWEAAVAGACLTITRVGERNWRAETTQRQERGSARVRVTAVSHGTNCLNTRAEAALWALTQVVGAAEARQRPHRFDTTPPERAAAPRHATAAPGEGCAEGAAEPSAQPARAERGTAGGST